ncbi:MAG: hypothetical protein OCD01_07915 [Fibrobacterales bacterium]
MRLKPLNAQTTITDMIEQSQSVYDRPALSEEDYKTKMRDLLPGTAQTQLETDELQHISDMVERYEQLSKQYHDSDERVTLRKLMHRKPE